MTVFSDQGLQLKRETRPRTKPAFSASQLNATLRGTLLVLRPNQMLKLLAQCGLQEIDSSRHGASWLRNETHLVLATNGQPITFPYVPPQMQRVDRFEPCTFTRDAPE